MFATAVTIAPGVTVGKISHGLMMMTCIRPEPLSDEQCFESIKAGVDSLPSNVKMFLNSGEFYGPAFSTANLEMLARFFEKYPEYAARTFLSVKGGTKKGTVEFDSSADNLRRSVDACNAALRGKKRIDLFEPARVDPSIPVEKVMETLKVLVGEGKFDYIGLSECSAATLQRAAKVTTITAVEIEISPMSYEEETKKVIAAAKTLGVAVLGYSPVARGLLTMTITSVDDLDAGDGRRHLTRFKGDNFSHNAKIAAALKEIAVKHGATPAQLSIAWVSALGPHVIPLPGSSAASRTLENCAAIKFELSQAEVEEITAIVEEHGVVGDRYFGGPAESMRLWG